MREYTVSEAARELGLTPVAVRWRIAHGLMKARRVGARLLVITERELERARELGTLTPGPKPKRKVKDTTPSRRPGRPRKTGPDQTTARQTPRDREAGS